MTVFQWNWNDKIECGSDLTWLLLLEIPANPVSVVYFGDRRALGSGLVLISRIASWELRRYVSLGKEYITAQEYFLHKRFSTQNLEWALACQLYYRLHRMKILEILEKSNKKKTRFSFILIPFLNKRRILQTHRMSCMQCVRQQSLFRKHISWKEGWSQRESW